MPHRIDLTDLTSLPSPPSLVLRLLRAFGDEETDFGELAEICSQDAALAARILSVANSAAFRRRAPPFHDLDRALITLGLETVRTIALVTSVMQSFGRLPGMGPSELADFWRHALVCAHLARRLALTTGYPRPQEAYLSGLLHDIGKLVVAGQRGEGYVQVRTLALTPQDYVAHERTLFGTDHCEVGAALMSSWQLSSFLEDCARFHHEPVTGLRDAHLLIRLVYVANALDSHQWLPDQALAVGDGLLGLTATLLARQSGEARAEVGQLAEALGIGVSATGAHQAPSPLQQEVRDTALVTGVRAQLDPLREEPALLESIARCITILFGVDRTRFFIPAANASLRGVDPLQPDAPFNDLACSTVGGASLVARAFTDGDLVEARVRSQEISVLDRQVLGDGDGALLLPLRWSGHSRAVAVLDAGPAQRSRLLSNARLLTLFAAEAGRVLGDQQERRERERREQEDHQLLEHGRLQQLVHEANNPLSIAQSYLELLGQRLGEDEDLDVLREELDRVGAILVRLVEDEPQPATKSDSEDPARLVRRLVGVLDRALCRPRGIALALHCDSAVPALTIDDDALKQVLLNLIRNAAEAVADGGRIGLNIAAGVNVQGRSHIELSVTDDGPGVPEASIPRLFQPVTSTKSGHAGVGLAIVRTLVEQAGGLVTYRTAEGGGARFQILIPVCDKTPPRRSS